MEKHRWSIIAYTDESTFEKTYYWRDASTSPGTTQFSQWITEYSTQINGELGVSTDVGAFGDNSHTSNTIVTSIGQLLEAMFIYAEDRDKTPLTERDEMIIPHIKDAQFLSIRESLKDLKGQLPTIASDDPPAFNFDLDVTEGGYDWLRLMK